MSSILIVRKVESNNWAAKLLWVWSPHPPPGRIMHTKERELQTSDSKWPPLSSRWHNFAMTAAVSWSRLSFALVICQRQIPSSRERPPSRLLFPGGTLYPYVRGVAPTSSLSITRMEAARCFQIQNRGTRRCHPLSLVKKLRQTK